MPVRQSSDRLRSWAQEDSHLFDEDIDVVFSEEGEDGSLAPNPRALNGRLQSTNARGYGSAG